ncbi:MAG: hypothetical protein RPS47_10065 [Colwellia sp.]|jgi:hypothetical protein
MKNKPDLQSNRNRFISESKILENKINTIKPLYKKKQYKTFLVSKLLLKFFG